LKFTFDQQVTIHKNRGSFVFELFRKTKKSTILLKGIGNRLEEGWDVQMHCGLFNMFINFICGMEEMSSFDKLFTQVLLEEQTCESCRLNQLINETLFMEEIADIGDASIKRLIF
jgi:hypothetical protein